MPSEAMQITPAEVPDVLNREATDESEASPSPEKKKENEPVDPERLADHGLLEMQKILGPLMNEVTIFASSAMYLLGKTKRDKEEPDWQQFHKPPGDLDAAVPSLTALEQIREHLARTPGVEFGDSDEKLTGLSEAEINEARQGKFSGYPGQETKRLVGRIPVTYEAIVDGKVQQVTEPYEFEFFYKSRMVNDKDLENPAVYRGFKFLNPDALLRQHNENAKYEKECCERSKKSQIF